VLDASDGAEIAKFTSPDEEENAAVEEAGMIPSKALEKIITYCQVGSILKEDLTRPEAP